MSAANLKNSTVEALQEAVQTMMTFEWNEKVSHLSEAEQKDASEALDECQLTRARLENSELVDIEDELKANQSALEAGTQRLSEALARFEGVNQVLTAVRSLISVAGQVVSLVA